MAEMTRRALFALAAAALLDPERLLFIPGKKLISIPKPAPVPIIYVGDILTFGDDPLQYRVTNIVDGYIDLQCRPCYGMPSISGRVRSSDLKKPWLVYSPECGCTSCRIERQYRKGKGLPPGNWYLQSVGSDTNGGAFA